MVRNDQNLEILDNNYVFITIKHIRQQDYSMFGLAMLCVYAELRRYTVGGRD